MSTKKTHEKKPGFEIEMAESAPPKERRTKVQRELPVPMDKAQIDQAATALASLNREKRTIETELAAYAGDKRKRLKAIRKEENRYADEIGNARRLVMVECEQVVNFETNTLTTKRGDTGEVVETRALQADERQLSIDDIDPGAPKKTRKKTGGAK